MYDIHMTYDVPYDTCDDVYHVMCMVMCICDIYDSVCVCIKSPVTFSGYFKSLFLALIPLKSIALPNCNPNYKAQNIFSKIKNSFNDAYYAEITEVRSFVNNLKYFHRKKAEVFLLNYC